MYFYCTCLKVSLPKSFRSMSVYCHKVVVPGGGAVCIMNIHAPFKIMDCVVHAPGDVKTKLLVSKPCSYLRCVIGLQDLKVHMGVE